MAVLARKKYLLDHKEWAEAEALQPVADKIVKQTRNFHGVE